MKASNHTTQNITNITENTSEIVNVVTEPDNMLTRFRTYIVETTKFEHILLYLLAVGIVGVKGKLVYSHIIDKKSVRKTKYYYISDTINVLYYKMDLPITDRDYYIKTILLREFEADQDTKQLFRFYDNTHATLFVSGHQLKEKNIKFTQVGINEDNDNHKYKTFAELLATIRFIIEQTLGATVWIYIDPVTLLPSVHICNYDNKKRKWRFTERLTNFETGVSIGYIGVNMYDIDSKDTVDVVKEHYNDFVKILNESVSAQVNETVHTLPEDKQLINFYGDFVVIDNRFSFYYTISHKTIAPLIRYLIDYLDIDINALVSGNVKIKQDSVDNYLKYTFNKSSDLSVHGQTLNKLWKCDFGVVTECRTQNDDRDKTMLLNCLPLTDLTRLNSFDLVSYLYAKKFPDIVINFVLARHPHATYEDIVGLTNVYNLLYEVISFDSLWINGLESNRDFKIWYLVLYMYQKSYKDKILKMLKSSYYIKLILLTIDSLDCTETCIEVVMNTMLSAKRKMNFEEAYKLVHGIPDHSEINEYWSMTLDLLRLIGPDYTNDELRLNKKLLFKMIDKECEC